MFLSVTIAFESFGRSNRVGTYDEGQFILVDGVRLPPPGTGPWDLRVGGDDPSAADQIAVALHTFDREGRHREGVLFALRRKLSLVPPFFEYEFSPYQMFFAWPFDGTYDT